MKDSNIEWTDHTFNPWIGCTKVSEGCKFCYAEAQMDHRFGRAKWGPQGARVRTSPAYWRKPLQWDREAAEQVTRKRVFCASLADVFEDRPELRRWRNELFLDLIDETPSLDWLLLTKRPENIMDMLPPHWRYQSIPDNVWIGTSVEHQKAADKRIPHLLEVPAAVRFLSCEPLLGPVSLDRWFGLQPGNRWAECLCDEIDPADRPCITCEARRALGEKSGIHWVIVGGESGPKARPMHPDWARSIRDQCQNAGVPFFFKQWGEWLEIDCMTDEQYGRVADLDPEALGGVARFKAESFLFPVCSDQGPGFVFRIGKKHAGRLLDGREWNEVPSSCYRAGKG